MLFWAPWCPPCRIVDPVFKECSIHYQGKANFYKLNTDENPETASEYEIRSIPTIIIFKYGAIVDIIVSGAVPKKTLTNAIEKYL